MVKQTRATRQKELLRHKLAAMHGMFSAQELYVQAKSEDPGIGIATVYRFLAAQRGQNFHSFTCDRKTIYADKNSHCHFVCTVCGRSTHFAITKADFLKELGGEICHFQIEVHGVCKECKNN
jgi:Fur family ferric uptake transcriptional regulator